MLSGPEVFTLIFLQFLPKTRLAKYDHYLNFTQITLGFLGISNKKSTQKILHFVATSFLLPSA